MIQILTKMPVKYKIIANVSHATFQSFNAFLNELPIMTRGFTFSPLEIPPPMTSFVDLKQIKKQGIEIMEKIKTVKKYPRAEFAFPPPNFISIGIVIALSRIPKMLEMIPLTALAETRSELIEVNEFTTQFTAPFAKEYAVQQAM